MAGLTITTAWSETAITLAEAKTHLRLEGSEDDTYLNSLISASQFAVEKYTGRAITNQTLKLSLEFLKDHLVNLHLKLQYIYQNNF